MGIVIVLGRWAFFFKFEEPPSWIAKNILPPLEPNLLVIWERIGEVLKVVYGIYQFAETWY